MSLTSVAYEGLAYRFVLHATNARMGLLHCMHLTLQENVLALPASLLRAASSR